MAETNLNFILDAQNRVSGEISKVNSSLKALKNGQDDAAASAEKGNMSFGKFVAGIGIGNLVAQGASQAFGFLKDQLGEVMAAAEESDRIQVQLNAAIKSTGGAAGVTAQMANDLAASIQATTPISDEAAGAAENMLLTFTSIGKDVFPDATRAIADMATGMNNGLTPSAEQLSTTAIQIGKALNDPIAGVTALRKVGVQLTEQQKDQIKVMMDAGDQAGAQRIILAELSKEFGGRAAAALDTYAGKQQKLKNDINNAQEAFGQAIQEGIQPFQKAFADFVSSDRFKAWVKDATVFIKDFASYVAQNAGPALNTLKNILKTVVSVFQEWAPLILGATAGIVAYQVVMGTVSVALKIAAAAQAVLNAVMMANPIGLVIAAVAALAVGLAVLASTTSNAETEEQKLNKQRQDSINIANQLKDGENELKDARYDQQGAALALESAQKRANNAITRYGATSLEAREAAYSLEGAQKRLSDANKKVEDSTAKITTAQQAQIDTTNNAIRALDKLNGKTVTYYINGQEMVAQKLSNGQAFTSAKFADGGYTGPGGKDEVAGIVHKGEFVIPQSDVDQGTGLPKPSAWVNTGLVDLPAGVRATPGGGAQLPPMQTTENNISLSISVGMYAGLPSEKRQIAVQLYTEMQREARAHGVQLPSLGSANIQ